MSTRSSCEWQLRPASGSEAWVRIPADTLRGQQTVSFTVASARDVPQIRLPRTSEVAVNGRSEPSDSWQRVSSIVIEQTGPTCTYSLSSPTTQVFNASGGNGTVSVTTESTCDWYAEESATGEDWIFMSVQTRLGPGTASYTVRPASQLPQIPLPRSADIIVFGRTLRDELERVLSVRIEQR